MKFGLVKKITIILLVGSGLAFAGYWVGAHPQVANAPSSGDSTIKRKVLYWHDPMVPGQKFDKPGKSPFMDMQLVPVYADEAGTENGVRIAPGLQQNLGIRYGTVKRSSSGDSLELVGTTQFDESLSEVLQSRTTGYIDRLYARAPMQRVKRGEPIASVFVPEWIAPQEEYLALQRMDNQELVSAARQRMRAMSIPNALISQLDRTGKPQNHLVLTSPVSGVITELGSREGAMVSPGMTIAKISGLQKIWLIAEIPEAISASAKIGMSVDAWANSNPERKYVGQLKEILAGVSTATRTLQARVELDNRDQGLTPGLLMRVQFAGNENVSRLTVPTEAVISTGARSVVLVVDEATGIRPVVVTTGRDIGDDTEILTGLQEGQKVVTSGQFLIDSEASLKAILPKLASNMATPAATQAKVPGTGLPLYRGKGKVEKITPEAITLSHQPVPELKWGAMTMDFNRPSPSTFGEVKQGQEVDFSFRESKDGYMLESVTPASGGKK